MFPINYCILHAHMVKIYIPMKKANYQKEIVIEKDLINNCIKY